MSRRLMYAGIGIIVAPWALILLTVMVDTFDSWLMFDNIHAWELASFVSALGVFVLYYRLWWLGRFTLAYVRESTAVHSGRSEPYAKAFANANGTAAEKKLFLFRIK